MQTPLRQKPLGWVGRLFHGRLPRRGVQSILLSLTSLAMLLGAGCGESAPPADEPADVAVADSSAWVTLFDGTSTEQWRGFRRDDFPDDGWRVEEGALTPRPDGTVVDLITRGTYRHFELELEWRVAPNGNSGIFVHVSEDHPEVWHTGPEFQVLDNDNHPDGQTPETSAGSIYALAAPSAAPVRPAGEWNSARFVVRGPRLAHTLNGQAVLEVDLESDAFRNSVAASTFASMPDFARRFEGHVALQHSSVSPLRAPVWFRNVRIRTLDEN